MTKGSTEARLRSPRARLVLHDPADIDRLVIHLFTRRKLPRVEVRIDRLPDEESHRAQDRIVRLAEACNCTLGEALAGITLLIGSCLACIGQEWRYLWFTLAATAAAFLLGKGIEVAWNRTRLLRSLRFLRNQIADAIAGHYVPSAAPNAPATSTYDYPLNSREGDALATGPALRPAPAAADRPRLDLRDQGDIDLAVRHLAGRWKLPRIVIGIRGLSAPVIEHAQDRLVRLSAGYSYRLAGMIGFVTFVVSMTYVMRPPKDVVLWTLHQGWGDFAVVLLVTLLATLVGAAGEVLWVRMQLLRVLRELKRQMQAA